jgi:hypothetical protein
MKFKFLTLLTVLSFYTVTSFATEYIYRDLMANTLPPPKCEAKSEAVARASKQSYMNRYTKKFCRSQGYGWSFTEVKNTGKSVCNECSDQSGKYRCYAEGVVVKCQRIKPGTVGMLPGKG